MKKNLLLLFTVLVLVAPLSALDRIPPGADLFYTRGDGSTFMSFASNPVPAGFFCPGSLPFTGRVEFRGLPIAGAGGYDTIIERIDEVDLSEKAAGSTRIRVRAVQLESLKPLTTSCGNFILRAYLAPREQPITRMRVTQTEGDGGYFTASLSLNLRLVFSPVAGKGPDRVLEDTINFGRSSRLPWASVAGTDAPTTGITVDTNGDGRPETRLLTSRAFVAGQAPSGVVEGGGTLFGAPEASSTTFVETDTIQHQIYDHEHNVCALPC